MAVAMFLHWDGITPNQYDALMARLELDTDPAAGSVMHLATFSDEGLEMCDVWRTEQAFESFLEHRLLPLAEDLELEGGPEYRFMPLHNLFAADPATIDRIGMMSVPAAVASWAS